GRQGTVLGHRRAGAGFEPVAGQDRGRQPDPADVRSDQLAPRRHHSPAFCPQGPGAQRLGEAGGQSAPGAPRPQGLVAAGRGGRGRHGGALGLVAGLRGAVHGAVQGSSGEGATEGGKVTEKGIMTLSREFMVEFLRYRADQMAAKASAKSKAKEGLEEEAKQL